MQYTVINDIQKKQLIWFGGMRKTAKTFHELETIGKYEERKN